MPCTKCKKNYIIVNKKYGLCNSCNYERLNNKTIIQNRKERHQESLKNKKPIQYTEIQIKPLNKSKIKQQTIREKQIKTKLSLLKKEIELDAILNNEYYCKGCGTSKDGLDKSHILSVGKYKHLELVKDNIQLLCRSCHLAWESNNIDKMMKLNCFEDNLLIIKRYDLETYRKLVTKMER